MGKQLTLNLPDKIGIYAIINTANGKQYIGQAVNMRKRQNTHRMLLNHNSHGNSHLQNAFNIYGVSAFAFRIIEVLDDTSLLESRERYWMEYYDTLSPEKGYNMNDARGSRTGRKHTKESIAKMRVAKRGYSPSIETRHKLSEANKGKRPSEETKAKMSIAHKGKKLSDETKARISTVLKGHGKGRTLSTETKAKISIAKMGHQVSDETKRKISERAKNRHSAEREQLQLRLF